MKVMLKKKPRVPPTEFHHFKSLPPELRLKIWEYASHHPQIITIYPRQPSNPYASLYHSLSHLFITAKPQHEPLYYLTPESHSVYMRSQASRALICGRGIFAKETFCNPERDIFWLKGFQYGTPIHELRHTFPEIVSRRVRNLVVEHPVPVGDYSILSPDVRFPYSGAVCEIFMTFPFLESLSFVREKNMRERIMVLAVKEYKSMWSVSGIRMELAHMEMGDKCPRIEWIDA